MRRRGSSSQPRTRYSACRMSWRLPISALRRLFRGANEHGWAASNSCLQMVMRNVAGVGAALRMPVPARCHFRFRDQNRGTIWKLRGLKKPRPVIPLRPAIRRRRRSSPSGAAPAESKTGTENSAPRRAAFSRVSLAESGSSRRFTVVDSAPRKEDQAAYCLLAFVNANRDAGSRPSWRQVKRKSADLSVLRSLNVCCS